MVFKYLTPQRIDVLQSACIRLSQPTILNDPFEARPFTPTTLDPSEIDSTAERLFFIQTGKNWSDMSPEYRSVVGPKLRENVAALNDASIGQRFMEECYRSINETLGIVCFSERADSLLMWSHYCDGHRGYVIGFDCSSPWFSEVESEDHLWMLRPVEYRRERPRLAITQLSIEEHLLVKNDEWAYEQEWRLIGTLNYASRIKDSDLYPIHLVSFPRECVCQVIVGAQAEDSLREAIRLVLDKEDGFSNAQLYEARLDPAEYRVKLIN